MGRCFFKTGIALCLYLPFCIIAATTVQKTFTVSASVNSGCSFSGTSSLGTINFGTTASLRGTIDVASSANNGSIILTCTPGIPVTIELNYGLNNGSINARYMANSTATQTIAYQLYKDAGRTSIWGTGAQALAISSFPATAQTYTIYARVFPSTTLPLAGTYTDTVTATITY